MPKEIARDRNHGGPRERERKRWGEREGEEVTVVTK